MLKGSHRVSKYTFTDPLHLYIRDGGGGGTVGGIAGEISLTFNKHLEINLLKNEKLMRF